MEHAEREIGMFEVKTHFSEVVDRVVREGRAITVTRRGKPVVDIVPTSATQLTPMSREEALEALRLLQEEVGNPLSLEEIQDITNEGRNRCPDL